MSEIENTPMTHRLAAVLLLIITVSLIWDNFISEPKLQNQALKDDILHQQDLLSRYQSIALAGPDLKEQLETLKTSSKNHAYILTAKSTAEATAHMQSHIKDWAREADLNIKQLRMLPIETSEDKKSITMRVTASGTIPAIKQWLLSIKTAKPSLYINKISLRNRQGSQRSRQRNPGDIPITLTAEIGGYLK